LPHFVEYLKVKYKKPNGAPSTPYPFALRLKGQHWWGKGFARKSKGGLLDNTNKIIFKENYKLHKVTYFSKKTLLCVFKVCIISWENVKSNIILTKKLTVKLVKI